jgi:pimeloyl-ACP methyl ester carboxylesterase
LLDTLKIQKADVLGFSLGSLVAQELTIMHPEKVNRLILYASLCGDKESIFPNPQVLKALAISQSKEIDPLSNVMRQLGAVGKRVAFVISFRIYPILLWS